LNADYWSRVDRVCDTPVDELYVDAGSMRIGTLKCEGRTEIRAFFIERNAKEIDAQRTTRHTSSGLRITESGPARWRIQSTVQVLSGNGEWPMASAPPSSVGDFDDIVVRLLDGRLLYESRTARIVFAGSGAATFAR
jgi:hypothetical protein